MYLWKAFLLSNKQSFLTLLLKPIKWLVYRFSVLELLPKTKYENNFNFTFMGLTFGYDWINVGFVGNVGGITIVKASKEFIIK